MSGKKELLNLIAPEIENIESAMRRDVQGLAGTMDGLLIEILEFGLFGGGKRFRPLLAVMAAKLCSGQGLNNNIYDLAIGFEYLHLATLFHDDVIDRADLRRGKPTVCKQYGLEAAILAGDFLHARSMEIIGKLGGTDCLTVFCKATAAMVDGEFVQLRNSQNYNQSRDDYFRAIDGKTALLISATTEIGALCGGADSHQVASLKEYGKKLGYGFQIIDDLLDYTGDEEKTGKKTGNDLLEGKMTLPIILAVEEASDGDKDRLLNILGDKEKRAISFSEVVGLMEKYDSLAKSKKIAAECIQSAIDCLAVFPDTRKKEKEILCGLAGYVLSREK